MSPSVPSQSRLPPAPRRRMAARSPSACGLRQRGTDGLQSDTPPVRIRPHSGTAITSKRHKSIFNSDFLPPGYYRPYDIDGPHSAARGAGASWFRPPMTPYKLLEIVAELIQRAERASAPESRSALRELALRYTAVGRASRLSTKRDALSYFEGIAPHRTGVYFLKCA